MFIFRLHLFSPTTLSWLPTNATVENYKLEERYEDHLVTKQILVSQFLLRWQRRTQVFFDVSLPFSFIHILNQGFSLCR